MYQCTDVKTKNVRATAQIKVCTSTTFEDANLPSMWRSGCSFAVIPAKAPQTYTWRSLEMAERRHSFLSQWLDSTPQAAVGEHVEEEDDIFGETVETNEVEDNDQCACDDAVFFSTRPHAPSPGALPPLHRRASVFANNASGSFDATENWPLTSRTDPEVARQEWKLLSDRM
ncbi:MAG: hypothetical protein MHM6MM_001229 [Cercozoa sp. M6MM]